MRGQVKLLDFYDVEARYPNAMEEVIPAEFYSNRDAEQATPWHVSSSNRYRHV
jgi:hypothetical protein